MRTLTKSQLNSPFKTILRPVKHRKEYTDILNREMSGAYLLKEKLKKVEGVRGLKSASVNVVHYAIEERLVIYNKPTKVTPLYDLMLEVFTGMVMRRDIVEKTRNGLSGSERESYEGLLLDTLELTGITFCVVEFDTYLIMSIHPHFRARGSDWRYKDFVIKYNPLCISEDMDFKIHIEQELAKHYT